VKQSAEDNLNSKALQTVGALAKLPVVRVDREAFLRKHFGGSPHLDTILARGPQVVFSIDSLRRNADSLIEDALKKAVVASFVTGLTANPIAMIPLGGADVAQYFGFAVNLAQQLAYLFGEDDLFEDGGELSEAAQVRVIGYLGVMFGAAGAGALLATTSRKVGVNVGKKVAAKALTKSAWYRLLKKVGAQVGTKITKESVGKTVAKSVPVLGGLFSGGLTYVTFGPMGRRLADTLARHVNGEFDDELVVNESFSSDTVVLADVDGMSDPSTPNGVG